jgi:peroxiredoxin Q/BCP
LAGWALLILHHPNPCLADSSTIGSSCAAIVIAICVGELGEDFMWIRLLIAAVVVIVVAVAACRFISAKLVSARSAPAVGSAAPDFSLSSQEGLPVGLKDYRGKWVVLYFYPKDFTSGCTIEAHNFQRDQAQYAQRGAVVLGVSVDSADSHRRFCAKEGLNFKLLADTDKQVSKEYGSLMNLGVVKIAARHTFIIDPQGRIQRVYNDVAPNTHSQEILIALDDLQKLRASTAE